MKTQATQETLAERKSDEANTVATLHSFGGDYIVIMNPADASARIEWVGQLQYTLAQYEGEGYVENQLRAIRYATELLANDLYENYENGVEVA